MKKIILSLIVVFGLAWIYSARVHSFGLEPEGAGSIGAGGMQYVSLTSSGMAFARAGLIYQVYTSTGNPLTDWFQLFDTQTLNNAAQTAYTTFANPASSQTLVPPTLFFSTATSNATLLNKVLDFTPYGELVSTGCFVYFSQNGTSSRTVTIMYRK